MNFNLKLTRSLFGGYMKRLTPLALLAILALTLNSQLLAQPKMSLPESAFEFGYVPHNSKISHVFWIHSTGTDSLKIVKVSPG